MLHRFILKTFVILFRANCVPFGLFDISLPGVFISYKYSTISPNIPGRVNTNLRWVLNVKSCGTCSDPYDLKN